MDLLESYHGRLDHATRGRWGPGEHQSRRTSESQRFNRCRNFSHSSERWTMLGSRIPKWNGYKFRQQHWCSVVDYWSLSDRCRDSDHIDRTCTKTSSGKRSRIPWRERRRSTPGDS